MNIISFMHGLDTRNLEHLVKCAFYLRNKDNKPRCCQSADREGHTEHQQPLEYPRVHKRPQENTDVGNHHNKGTEAYTITPHWNYQTQHIYEKFTIFINEKIILYITYFDSTEWQAQISHICERIL